MKYYVLRYAFIEVGAEGEETNRWEFENFLDAINLFAAKVGVDNLYDAMQHSFSEQVYMMTDHEGYALATDFEIDPLD